jgi:hypothetical protein
MFFFSRSIREKAVSVHLAGGGPDSKGKLLKELAKGGPGKQNGSSFRWAIGATREGDLELQLQAIPLPVAEVKARPLLMADNVAVHVMTSWPIKGLTFDGQAGLNGTGTGPFHHRPRGAGREAGTGPGQLQAPPEQGHERVSERLIPIMKNFQLRN